MNAEIYPMNDGRGASIQALDTDIANCKRLVDRYGQFLRYSDQVGWICWDGRRWVPDKHLAMMWAKNTARGIYDEINSSLTQEDRESIFKWAKRSQDERRLHSMLNLAQSEPGILIGYAEFDTEPDLLNLNNGIFAMHTQVLRQHEPEWLGMRISEIDADPDAECPLWLSFLERVMDGNQKVIDFLQRAVGYSLSGYTTEQVLFFLWGRGANGKSVFLEILLSLAGEYGSVTPEQTLRQGRRDIPNDIARLAGARIVIVNEISDGIRFNEGRIKDLTGGDTVSARFLHKEWFDFRPQFKLWLRGNYKPTITGTDDGIWRRFLLIPFLVQIPPDEQDKNLLAKLQGELPGILNWALEGNRQWRDIGLEPPDEVRAAVSQYREEMDLLGQFIEEFCISDDCRPIKSSLLLTCYNAWAVKLGGEMLSAVSFSQRMEARGFEKRRSTRGTFWQGIQLKNS